MRRSPAGDSQVKLMLRLSTVPVKFLGGPVGAECMVFEIVEGV